MLLGEEIRHEVGQYGLRQRHRTAHAHDAAHLGAELGDRVLRSLRLLQHRAAMRVEALADLGHGEASRGPLQQAHAEALLEQRDALAEA